MSSRSNSTSNTMQYVGLGALGATAAFFAFRYRVAAANEYIVKTGLGIKDIQVAKTTILFPFQMAQVIKMNPNSYTFILHHISKELVPFSLPTTFTISPIDPQDDVELFKNYARTMSKLTPQELEHTIKAVIHGETRVLAAQMTIDDMFSDKEMFKRIVATKIQADLNQFGLKINNSNISELSDFEDNKYFAYRKLRAIEGANNAARVDVAEAKKLGDIGEQERIAATRQRKAELEANTVIVENKRDRDIAESAKDLSVARSQFQQLEEVARIESNSVAQIIEMERMKEIEAKRVAALIEKQRSTELVQAKVTAEAMIERTEAEAEAIRRIANANLYSELKKAEGSAKMYEVQADGVSKLLSASGNNPQLLQFYLGSTTGLYVNLADKAAHAVQGLQPKINVWNTGNDQDAFAPIRNIMTSIPPLLDAVQSTGIMNKPASKDV